MRIDSLVMCADDVTPGDGKEFYGTPISFASPLAAEVREERDTRVRVRAGLGIDSVPVALLPGEVLKDNVIRRETAAEVIGEDFYKQEDGEEGITDLQAPDYWDDYEGRCA
jgi:hypothetical protein